MIKKTYKRHVEPRLKESLEDSPVVLIQGPRQCGKTTLAQRVGEPLGYQYFTLDDDNTRNYAVEDPVGFVNSLPERAILDEAQLAPGLFPSIKLSVDRNRSAGRFMLTGSVDLLQMRQVKESLAGRMDIVRLHPFSQSELEQTPPKFLDDLFSPKFTVRQNLPSASKIIERIMAGGYPAAIRRPITRRSNWYQAYIETLVEKDAPLISNIHALDALPKLLELAAVQTAQLLNINNLASSFKLNRLTIQNYLVLLEKMFLLERIPAWHGNYKKRITKTSKIHLKDTGVICALLNFNKDALLDNREILGHLLETFVLQELQRQASAHIQRHAFYHFRDRDRSRAEVDIVIERGATALAGVEVKASGTITNSDFKGLRKLKEITGKRFKGGVLLYTGDSTLNFGENLYALPVRTLWEKNK